MYLCIILKLSRNCFYGKNLLYVDTRVRYRIKIIERNRLEVSDGGNPEGGINPTLELVREKYVFFLNNKDQIKVIIFSFASQRHN